MLATYIELHKLVWKRDRHFSIHKGPSLGLNWVVTS